MKKYINIILFAVFVLVVGSSTYLLPDANADPVIVTEVVTETIEVPVVVDWTETSLPEVEITGKVPIRTVVEKEIEYKVISRPKQEVITPSIELLPVEQSAYKNVECLKLPDKTHDIFYAMWQ